MKEEAIESYVQPLVSRAATLAGRFTEVESGRRNDCPEFEKALQLAHLTGATLMIAKLDRLSRNAAFLLTLQASGVRFLAVDMPEANDLKSRRHLISTPSTSKPLRVSIYAPC